MSTQTTYRAMVATAPGKLTLVERAVPQPGRGQVRIRVQACGVCHSDSATVERAIPAGGQGLVPGHEVVGRIEAIGADVTGWKLGQRVGVGFLGGEDGTCPSCRHGDPVNCANPIFTGMNTDGGYAEIMLAEARGLVRVPDALTAAEAAPLLCAGLTTFNALRNAGAKAGDVVAIHGLGGLGHLAVQFASRMGFYTVAVARGADKAELAAQLGAHRYIDAEAENVAEVMHGLGGAAVVLGTAPTGKGMAEMVRAIKPRGKLVVVAVPQDTITLSAVDLVFGERTVAGALTGTVTDNEETLAFAQLQDVRPLIETFPFEQAQLAYDRMMRADVRFRAVLTMEAAASPLPESGGTEYIDVDNIRTAYRRLGRGDGTPLLLLQHFTGTMDNWDPDLVQALAAQRPVILLDNAGVGASHGTTPDTVDAMTSHAIAFVDALALPRIDVLGFSLGSFIAQQMAQRRPALLRKLLLVGGCPPGQGAASFRKVIADIAGKSPTDILLQLFFTASRASQALGAEFAGRLAFRDERGPNPPEQVFAAQYQAIVAWCESPFDAVALAGITHPVLVVQGSHDTMFPTSQSVTLFETLPNAQLSLYPDAGHASLFQYPALFAEQANYFLAAP